MWRQAILSTLVLLTLAPLTAPPARASGFSLYDAMGTRAMGLAGAFVARADDPSAIFYNVGGVGLLRGKTFSAGTAGYVLGDSLYQGLPPGIGAQTIGEQDQVIAPAPHVYWVKPLSRRFKIGLGINSPFLLDTEWNDPMNTFAGRFVSLRSQIETYDINPVFGCELTPHLGLGAGVVYRASELNVLRHFPVEDPNTGKLLDAASFDVGTSFDNGFGWNFGLLYRPSDRFSFGLAYRSEIELDYDGEATYTQIPTGDAQLDQLVAATLPLGQKLPVLSTIEFPATAGVGIGLGLGERLRTDVDVTWTGWSSFQQLTFALVNNPELSESLPLELDDAMAYRLGVTYRMDNENEIRFGVAYDESPQPTRTVGPFLPDADRGILAVGFGRDWLDLALQYQQLQERTVTDSVFGVNGRYRTNVWLVGVTISR